MCDSLRNRALPLALGLAVFASGCGGPKSGETHVGPSAWPYPSASRVAIVPVLNFTGENGFDPVRAADLLALEVGQMRGVTVIPVSRVTAALLRRGSPFVQSPAQAVEVCRAVGADAMLIPAITKYDPYSPMTVALTMELYLVPEAGGDGRQVLAASDRPAAQLQHVFDASRADVSRRVQAYGERHDQEVGEYGWRRYLVTQEGFLKYCFSEGLEMLFAAETDRMAAGKMSDG